MALTEASASKGRKQPAQIINSLVLLSIGERERVNPLRTITVRRGAYLPTSSDPVCGHLPPGVLTVKYKLRHAAV